MEIKEYIEKIVENGNVADMNELSEILDDVMEELCEYDENLYNKYKMSLYKMVYGNSLNREMAEEIVFKMKPYKQKWSLEEAKRIQQEYGLTSMKPIDFYVVINSAYNDYKDIFNEDVETYVRFAYDFINDEDAKEGKVFLYFTTIPE